MNFIGKVVLITGASSGIGAETAVLFSKLGASLSLTGRNENNLQNTAVRCTEARNDGDTICITAELNNEQDVEKIVYDTIQKFGQIDVLVNNAGSGKVDTIKTATLQQFDETIRLNLRSVFQLTKLTLPYLLQSKGNIVNVSSAVGGRPFPGLLTYGISKAALEQFTKCVALELAPNQVRVNSVSPGEVWTQFQERSGLSRGNPKEVYLKKAGSFHPIGRIGQTEDVVNAITFLASSLASNITGVILPVDGGLSIAYSQSPKNQ